MKKFDRSIWYNREKQCVEVIDQRWLPFTATVFELSTLSITAYAIREMVVRGAPLIGVTAAYGMYLGILEQKDPEDIYKELLDTRPTAVNLKWALVRQLKLLEETDKIDWANALLQEAHAIAEEDIAMCSSIGDHGVRLIQDLYDEHKRPVNILTHCNAGWLATVQWGTATAPIYKAHALGIPLHIWVDETRPRNQGARLTAWELTQAGIDFHVITDNAGGHLMQHGHVDILLTGSDRTTRQGDVCNKIGTYLKALAARDNDIPFYAALPSSTIDWDMLDGISEIPIEQRHSSEVTKMNSWNKENVVPVDIMPETTPVRNYAFDVTPAKYVTGIITERGISDATEQSLTDLFNI